MALYTFLPVYKTSYDLVLELFAIAKNFSKEYRYTIGEKLKTDSIEFVIMIYRANSKKDKYETLESAREYIETIRLVVRILKDLKQIGVERVVSVNEKIESISKQLTAWQKSLSTTVLGK